MQANTALAGGDVDAAGIHVRAVGPYQLTNAERSELWKDAEFQRACAGENGFSTGSIVEQPNGRPVVRVAGSADLAAAGCGSALDRPTDTEARALNQLATLAKECLGLGPSSSLALSLSFQVFATSTSEQAQARQDACVQAGRRTQLKPFVAPPALLFVTDPDTGSAQPTINLSRGNVLRIAGGTGFVLLLAVAVTVVVGTRLVRPLRQLIDATGRPVEHRRPVPVTTRDEIGVLATALNEQSARREQLEMQRTRLELLCTRLTARLQGVTSLSPGDYAVLLALTEATDNRLRSSELATRVGWERSRLSHHLGRMQRRQLIRREECATDSRGAEVVLEPAGAEAFHAATVPHLRAIRELFVDALTADQLAAAGEIAAALRAHLSRPAPPPEPDERSPEPE